MFKLSAVLLFLYAAVHPASAAVWYLTGRVVMADGSPLPKPVGIQRHCGVWLSKWETKTDAKGDYVLRRVEEDIFGHLTQFAQIAKSDSMNCVLKASLGGYESSAISFFERGPNGDPHLPPIVLYKRGEAGLVEVAVEVPRGASKHWSEATKALLAKNLLVAQRELRAAVAKAPKFAAAWNALGLVCEEVKNAEEARQAYRKAIEGDPALLGPYVQLTRLDIEMKDWEAARKDAAELLKADTRRRYPEAHLHAAVAKYSLGDRDGAEQSARAALAADTKHQVPRAEYILGLILEAKRDYAGAGEHMRAYLALAPKASDAETVRARLDKLGTPQATEPVVELSAADLNLPSAGEVWIPGGRKALAAAAKMENQPPYEDFFAEYCRTLLRFTSPAEPDTFSAGTGIHGYLDGLRSYFAAVTELARLGEQRGDRVVMTLSLQGAEQRRRTEQILALIGWRVLDAPEGPAIEISDRPGDGIRQPVGTALGIDEIAMQEALAAGRAFSFEIPTESARLIGGDGWSGVLPGQQPWPGGLAETFTRDLRLAKAYSGLSAAGSDTATALVAAFGLRVLTERYSGLLANYPDAFAVRNGSVGTPGGERAEAVWAKLTGSSPRKPAAFFRALMDRDAGKLAGFYCAVAKSDPAHQAFYTASAERASKFYAWFHASAELPGVLHRPNAKLEEIVRQLPLDGSGGWHFPGGRAAWAVARDGDPVLSTVLLERLTDLARIEAERGKPLDAASAGLILKNYGDWQPLFPHFERIPGLGAPEFEALAQFARFAAGLAPERRNLVLGEWHSLVELVALGSRAGSLSAPAGAVAFRRACSLGSAGVDAVAIVREMAGRGDLDEGVRSRLLRLDPERRARFERVLQLQDVPRLGALDGKQDGAKALAALAGLVYAFWADPDALLLAEDPLLVRKHRFAFDDPQVKRDPLFSPARLKMSNKAPGTCLSGGFMGIAKALKGLPQAGQAAEPAAGLATRPAAAPAGPAAAVSSPSDVVFRADARLVEVYASVTDSHGHYVDNLPRQEFVILDDGNKQDTTAFEPQTTDVNCALLLDTTLSMTDALPALKNAALKLIGELRPGDSVAVYAFANTVSLLQPFTTDKAAAKRAVLRTQAQGQTALYDALVRVSRDFSGRSGKKVIVLFTDGDDNLSTLTAEAAIQRVKTAGVPVHTVAQGVAFITPVLLDQLAAVSNSTGGLPFRIANPREIGKVFESVAQDLAHGYLLTFRPTTEGGSGWRTIRIQLRNHRGYKVRAREGYYP